MKYDTNSNQRALNTTKPEAKAKGRILMKAMKVITDIGWYLYKAYRVYEWIQGSLFDE